MDDIFEKYQHIYDQHVQVDTADKTNADNTHNIQVNTSKDAASQTLDNTSISSNDSLQTTIKEYEEAIQKLNEHIEENVNKVVPATQRIYRDKFISIDEYSLNESSYITNAAQMTEELDTDVHSKTNNQPEVSRYFCLQTERNTDKVDTNAKPMKRSPKQSITADDNIRQQDLTKEPDLKYIPDEMSVDENEKSENETIVPCLSSVQPDYGRKVKHVSRHFKSQPDTITYKDSKHQSKMRKTIDGTDDISNVFKSTYILKEESFKIADNTCEVKQTPRVIDIDRKSEYENVDIDTGAQSERNSSFDMDVHQFFNKSSRYSDKLKSDVVDISRLNESVETNSSRRKRIQNVQSKVDHSWHKNYPILKHIQSGCRSRLTAPNVEQFGQIQEHSGIQHTHKSDSDITQTKLDRIDELPLDVSVTESTYNAFLGISSSTPISETPRSVISAYKTHQNQRLKQLTDIQQKRREYAHQRGTIAHREHRPFISKAHTSRTESELSTSSSDLIPGGRYHTACFPEHTQLWWNKLKIPGRTTMTDEGKHNEISSNKERVLTQSLPDKDSSEKVKYKRYPQRWQKHTGLREQKMMEKEKQEKENLAKHAVSLPDVGVFYTRGNTKVPSRLNWYNNTKEVSMSKAVDVVRSRQRTFNDDGVKHMEKTPSRYRLESRVKEQAPPARQWQFKGVNYDDDSENKPVTAGFLLLDDELSDDQISELRSSADLDKFLNAKRKYKVCLKGNRMHYLSRKPHAKHHCEWPEF